MRPICCNLGRFTHLCPTLPSTPYGLAYLAYASPVASPFGPRLKGLCPSGGPTLWASPQRPLPLWWPHPMGLASTASAPLVVHVINLHKQANASQAPSCAATDYMLSLASANHAPWRLDSPDRYICHFVLCAANATLPLLSWMIALCNI